MSADPAFSAPTRTAARQIDKRDTGIVEPQVVRDSERPELWDAIENVSDEVWPEYNQHGDTLNHYWGQLYDTFPEWQFVLYDTDEKHRRVLGAHIWIIHAARGIHPEEQSS
jgi:hypothetical protein